MTGLRPRFRGFARATTDVLIVCVLALLWLTGDETLWLRVIYVAAVSVVFGLFAVLRARDRARLVADRLYLARQIDAIPFATAAYDGEANALTWNTAAEQLFGWQRDEIVGHQNPAVGLDAQTESRGFDRRVLAGEHLHGVAAKRSTRDGREVDVEIYTAPFEPGHPGRGFLVMYHDVGERRRAERERDQAQRHYRSLVEALPLVTYIDLVDDDVTNVYTSPQVSQLLGWTNDEWAAEPTLFERLLHPDDHDRVMAHVRACNETRRPFSDEYRLRHRDGRYIWVRDQSSILEDVNGIAYARGFLLDLTEQKRLEEQLLQAQKMDALGQLAGGIAHDFNNLLTGIGGYAELAASEVEPDSLGARCLHGIRSAAAEAASLTSRLLAFSRRDVAAPRALDLNEFVVATGELLQRLLREDVDLRLALGDGLPAVAADPAQLRQVILNLAVNARDAMPDGGTLTLETEAVADRVTLRVRDTGTGMDAETQRRALEPFFTTKPEGAGTGLGLAVVYGVVQSLRGSLQIESLLGAGTVVELSLPPTSDTPDDHDDADAGDRLGGDERVLIVEDRDVVRDLTRDVLEAAGFAVHVAANGDEGLALASGLHFDLVVTDVVMPGLSGPELAAALRLGTPELPVLFMSGYTDDILDASALALPHTGFLRKPFSGAVLVRRVRDLLDERAPARNARSRARTPPSRC